MEYAKDGIFQIGYNTKLNERTIKNEEWASRILKKISRHKFITTTIIAFLIFSTANVIMIYNFMKILQNI